MLFLKKHLVSGKTHRYNSCRAVVQNNIIANRNLKKNPSSSIHYPHILRVARTAQYSGEGPVLTPCARESAAVQISPRSGGVN